MKYVKLFETLLEYAWQNYVFRVGFIKILIKIYSSEIALRIIIFDEWKKSYIKIRYIGFSAKNYLVSGNNFDWLYVTARKFFAFEI